MDTADEPSVGVGGEVGFTVDRLSEEEEEEVDIELLKVDALKIATKVAE